MPRKDELVNHLRDLIKKIELGDGDDVFLDRIRNEYYPFLHPEIEYKLHSVEQKLEQLLRRASPSCRMASEEGNGILQMMTNVGLQGRAEAIQYLRGGFSGAKQLIICDPYFLLSNSKLSKQDYLSGISAAIPTTVKNIELYVKPRKRDADVAVGFTDMCKERGIRLTCRKTDELHDRVWIMDATRAFVVGASFNGLGNKPAFILELPEEDRRRFISEVGLLRERTTRSKSA